MVSKIAFLYFAFMAWGCLTLLPVVKLQEVGQGFYRFFGFLCVALDTLSLGLALFSGPDFDPNFHRAAWALGVSLFFTLCFTIALKVRVRWFLWGCFWVAVLSGGAAIGYFPWQAGINPSFLLFHAVCSSFVLAAGILAMMLGHWYLVTPKLSITPLKRYSSGYILLTVLTALELALSYFLYVGFGPQPATASGGQLIHEELIFTLFRVAWGIIPPLGMAYWIWETVRMKSTQSATGILYAAMVCTIIGEGMGLYLTIQTGVPF
jgi:hypothetical protein